MYVHLLNVHKQVHVMLLFIINYADVSSAGEL